eukprot:363712-Chlamydomonas_euryale.AAC.7
MACGDAPGALPRQPDGDRPQKQAARAAPACAVLASWGLTGAKRLRSVPEPVPFSAGMQSAAISCNVAG